MSWSTDLRNEPTPNQLADRRAHLNALNRFGHIRPAGLPQDNREIPRPRAILAAGYYRGRNHVAMDVHWR